MTNKDSVFRKKSIERISSPEELEQCIKAVNPSLWILLAAVIVFLAGVICWATIGKIDTKIEVGCLVENHEGVCLVSEENLQRIVEDTYILINDNKYPISSIADFAEADNTIDSYLLHTCSIEEGQWCAKIYFNTDLKEGSYKGSVVFESISPISFVLN